MNNLNLLGQLTAPTTVGSGVLLGCLFVAYIVFFVAIFKSLVIFGTILQDHYDDLDDRKRRQSDSEDIKPDSELDKLVRLSLYLLRGLRLIRRDNKLNLGHDRPLKLIGGIKTLKVSHFLDKVLNIFSGRGIHKSKNAAKQPNEKS